jgi:hypothetical protein
MHLLGYLGLGADAGVVRDWEDQGHAYGSSSGLAPFDRLTPISREPGGCSPAHRHGNMAPLGSGGLSFGFCRARDSE